MSAHEPHAPHEPAPVAPVSPAAPVAPRQLAIWPCQSVCVWKVTDERWREGSDELRVFACTGCGSEWVRTEPWTPVDAHGSVPPEVEREKRRGH